MQWARKVAAGLSVSAAAAFTAWTSASTSYSPQPPAPDAPDIFYWMVSGRDPLAVVTALLAAIGAGFSIWQMFQASPATRGDVKEAVAGETALVHQGLSVVAKKTEEQAAVTAELHSKTVEMHAQLQELLNQLTRSGVAPDQAKNLQSTASELLSSDVAEERSIGEEIVKGDPIAAADRLLASVLEERQKQAIRLRKAAHILAPFKPTRAIEVLQQALELNPSDAGALLELGRLHQQAHSLDVAASYFEQAARLETDPRERGVLAVELADLAIARRDFTTAAAHLASAMEATAPLAEEQPDTYLSLHDQSVQLLKMGDLTLAMGDLAHADHYFRGAVRIRERLLARFPDDVFDRRELAVAQGKLGHVALAKRDPAAATQIYQDVLKAFRDLLASDPDNNGRRRDVAITLEKLGGAAMTAGDAAQALAYFEEAVDHAHALILSDDGIGGWSHDLMTRSLQAGQCAMQLGDLDRSQSHLEAALKAADERATGAPDDADRQSELATALDLTTAVALQRRAYDDARATANRAFEIRAALLSTRPDSPTLRGGLAQNLYHLSLLAALDDDLPAALTDSEQAAAIAADLVGRHPDDPKYRALHDMVHSMRARLISTLDDMAGDETF